MVYMIAGAATLATTAGILSSGGSGPFEHTTVRGATVTVRGIGVYRHMTTDVAVQGIAQDYVTLVLGVPALLALGLKRHRSARLTVARLGVLAYFFVTYLFYMLMGTYNELYLVYVLIGSLSLFAMGRIASSLNYRLLPDMLAPAAPIRVAGRFLMVNAVLIALLWLQLVVPPLLDGTIIPTAVEHYTTLVVQGMDLGYLLPLSFLSGVWLARREARGIALGTVYLVFLSLLMTALSAKLVGMAIVGAPVMPAIVIIPVINLITIVFAVRMLRAIKG